jgi:transposase
MIPAPVTSGPVKRMLAEGRGTRYIAEELCLSILRAREWIRRAKEDER